jgi:ATP-binding cassette, subfamily A (ABC1), member 3
LFDNLTPEEHLSVFCDFKGFKGNKKDEIEKILKDVDLVHLKNTVAKKLSGGSKRKLSLGIALCGGSKVILLDEPTSGMDLTARR